VLVSAVTSGTGLGWNDVLAVARGEAEFEQLQQQRDEERLRADGGPLGLIGSRTVALMLGWSESAVIQMHQRDTGFPRAVIKLNAQSGWVADDIRA
jgi:predicted DNA-binding transcriptional regulator AlpA